jgi:hypothetical protein
MIFGSSYVGSKSELMAPSSYRLSFTTGGIFLRESFVAVMCYLALGDWKKARDHVRQENLLQVRTAAAATRISKEVTARLELLDTAELEAFVVFGLRDQAYLLWVAACRRYTFIREFATEVLREHHLSLRRELSFGDYDGFYNSKALWHAELDELAPSTQKKLRQNLFRMMREAGLITDQHIIQPALLSPSLAELLSRNRQDLMVFPVSDMEIQRWLA